MTTMAEAEVRGEGAVARQLGLHVGTMVIAPYFFLSDLSFLSFRSTFASSFLCFFFCFFLSDFFTLFFFLTFFLSFYLSFFLSPFFSSLFIYFLSYLSFIENVTKQYKKKSHNSQKNQLHVHANNH